MNIIKKVAATAVILAVLGIFVLPRMSFAQDYAVSPSFAGNGDMTVAMANQICTSLPDNLAAQQSFCAWSGVLVPPISIPDNNILIKTTSPTSVVITWSTSVPTTSTLWYADNPSYPNTSTEFTNTADGYTTLHTVNLTNLDLTARHLFMVGGSETLMTGQSTAVQVASAEQWL